MNKDGTFWVHLVECDFDFGEYIQDVERVSTPCHNIGDIPKTIERIIEKYTEDIKSGRYYIKVDYVWFGVEIKN